MKKNTQNQFLIGSWHSFYSFEVDGYEYQLDQMHEAGLNFNIFPGRNDGKKDEAEFWDDVERQYAARNMYYLMMGGLNEESMATAVAIAEDKEHCIGYYMKDEPGGAALPSIGRHSRAYREADDERYPFVNLFPSYAGEAILEGDYHQYCSRYVREVGPENVEYLSHDYYPFHKNVTCTTIFGDMEIVRRVAFENGRLRTHAFPQSSAWNGIRMPNIDEMRWNVYGYLAYGFKALSWFNLVCPGRTDTEGEGFYDSLIYRDGTIRNPQLFKDFGALNREVLTLGDTLMKLDTVHAYHTKDDVAGVEVLPKDWMITPVGDDNFIVSYMVTPKGDETYVMLFNKDWEKPVTASFRISEFSGIESMTYISPFDGSFNPVAPEDGIITEAFRPGEGKLYKLNGKLSYRVLPLDADHSRLDVDLPVATELVGVDLRFPLHENGMSVTAQICTNKKFTEDKTTQLRFENLSTHAKIRFEPITGKYIRLMCDGEQVHPVYGYAELRVRFENQYENTPCGSDLNLPESICDPAPVVIPRGVALDAVSALLPATVTAVYANGEQVETPVAWILDDLDTSLAGPRQLRGTITLPDGTPVPDGLVAHVQITVTYDVDFTNLDEAIAVVDGLVETEYTPESWKVVREYYDAAVAMKDGSYPQNAVTVAYWQLLDRVRELVPVQWTLPRPETSHVSAEKPGVHLAKGILPAAVATVAGAVAGALVGVLAFKSKKKKR